MSKCTQYIKLNEEYYYHDDLMSIYNITTTCFIFLLIDSFCTYFYIAVFVMLYVIDRLKNSL